MTDQNDSAADFATATARAVPGLEDWQHWTLVMGRAQQMMMDAWAERAG